MYSDILEMWKTARWVVIAACVGTMYANGSRTDNQAKFRATTMACKNSDQRTAAVKSPACGPNMGREVASL
jgi:hypothetical protein